jgi:hypothetical protein
LLFRGLSPRKSKEKSWQYVSVDKGSVAYA